MSNWAFLYQDHRGLSVWGVPNNHCFHLARSRIFYSLHKFLSFREASTANRNFYTSNGSIILRKWKKESLQVHPVPPGGDHFHIYFRRFGSGAPVSNDQIKTMVHDCLHSGWCLYVSDLRLILSEVNCLLTKRS